MLKVQEYLRKNSVEALTAELGIHINQYPEIGIMTLNYSQIDSPKHHEIVRECRALILTIDRPHHVVSRSFDRFFNYSECPRSSEFDITKYVGWEKHDGSIIPVYYNDGQWNASTRKMAFAEGVNTQGYNFYALFCGIFDFNKLDNVDKNLTLIFELVTPKNRIVRRYTEDKVYLLGVRNKLTGVEFNLEQLIEFSYNYGIELPKYYKFNTVDEIFASLKDLDPFDEGYVYVNYETCHRLKIKNPSYVAIAHLRDNGVISPKRIALLVMEQDQEEYLNAFPEDLQFFEPYMKAYDKMYNDIKYAVMTYSGIENQKEFALAIQNVPAKHILFNMRKGLKFDQALDKLSDDGKLNLLNSYVEREHAFA